MPAKVHAKHDSSSLAMTMARPAQWKMNGKMSCMQELQKPFQEKVDEVVLSEVASQQGKASTGLSTEQNIANVIQ
jgi:hypothetical protein